MNPRSIATDHDACGVGLVARIGGAPSREIVERALEALIRLAHRGGVDADGRSGDGAGLLTGMPDKFIRKCALEAGIDRPSVFGLCMVFLPQNKEDAARRAITALAEKSGLRCLGRRLVPTDPEVAGPRASEALPAIEQCFFAPRSEAPQSETADFEGLLFHFRKEAEAAAPAGTYFCSLSSRTVVYKGLLTPSQLPAFYADLRDPDFESPFAIFHQRYSTNTQPSWSLAQPFRFVAHNGEINTISSNRRWFRARSAGLRRQLGLSDNSRLLQPGMSDSASFDNALEALVRSGSNIAEAALRLVPPAWEHDEHLDPALRQFLAISAPEQEPWDGPAALIFTDGNFIGAKLDRNGLRPLRYTLTSDGLLIVGSEVGITDLSDKQWVGRQRLSPGEMLIADPALGTFFRPSEIAGLVRGETSSPTASRVIS